MILEILFDCSTKLGQPSFQLRQRAQKLAQEIAASVLYHLTSDAEHYLNSLSGIESARPGRPIGGLLLLHPLNVVLRCAIISPSLRAYSSKCLAWIGKNMSIGQATVLSKESNLLPIFILFEMLILI
mgnify:CR=1 FL=1